MKQYDIPLHLQDDSSEDCGPMAATMILDFFGVTSDSGEVIKKIPRSYFGTSAFDVALTLMNYGLSVTAVTANPLVFDGDFIRAHPNPTTVRERVKTIIAGEKDDGKKTTAEGLLQYIGKSGQLLIEVPNTKHIIKALDEGKLVLASTYANAIGKNEGRYHFVVIGGYEKNKFLIYNPWPKSRKKSWEQIDEVMFAIHAGTTFDYDNGSILVVGK